jgi:DNA-binding NarL/FixJ family response regulator
MPAAMSVRVMIVEDDVETLRRFSEAISRDLRTKLVGQAQLGRQAIASMAAARPQVLLVDLGLPDMHGTDVIRHAASRLPDCEIMVITAFGDERNVLASIEAGATGYVLKDCSDADLVRHVLELREGGAPMNPGIARLVLERARSSTVARVPPEAAVDVTARETDVLRLLARGYTYAEIATRLDVSINTVTSHIKSCYRKLAVHSGKAAVARAGDLGLLRGTRGEDGFGG